MNRQFVRMGYLQAILSFYEFLLNAKEKTGCNDGRCAVVYRIY
jgi:hypothetical protein